MSFEVFTTTARTADYARDAAADLVAKIAAHPGWEVVDGPLVIGGSYNYTVVKCLAASSGLPKDFYVSFQAGFSNNGILNWNLHEDYDAALHQFRRGAFYLQPSQAFDLAADATISGDTWHPQGTSQTYGSYSLAQAWTQVHPGVPASQEWALSVQKDCLVITPKLQLARWIGVFTSLVDNAAVADPMPIAQLTSFGYDYYFVGMTTRHPLKGGVAAVPHPGMLISPYPDWNKFATWEALMYPGVGFNDFDLLHSSRTPLWSFPVLMFNSNTATSNTKTHGYLRGRIDTVRYCQLNPAVGGWLDTINVDGVPWAYVGTATFGTWVSTAA